MVVLACLAWHDIWAVEGLYYYGQITASSWCGDWGFDNLSPKNYCAIDGKDTAGVLISMDLNFTHNWDFKAEA